MDEVRRRRAEPKAAAARIRGLFKGLPYVPTYFRWHDPNVRTTPAFTVWGMTRMYFWYFFRTPRALRKRLYDWSPLTGYASHPESLLENRRLALRRKRSYVRDVFKAWNDDWTAGLADPRPLGAGPGGGLPGNQGTSVLRPART